MMKFNCLWTLSKLKNDFSHTLQCLSGDMSWFIIAVSLLTSLSRYQAENITKLSNQNQPDNTSSSSTHQHITLTLNVTILSKMNEKESFLCVGGGFNDFNEVICNLCSGLRLPRTLATSDINNLVHGPITEATQSTIGLINDYLSSLIPARKRQINGDIKDVASMVAKDSDSACNTNTNGFVHYNADVIQDIMLLYVKWIRFLGVVIQMCHDESSNLWLLDFIIKGGKNQVLGLPFEIISTVLALDRGKAKSKDIYGSCASGVAALTAIVAIIASRLLVASSRLSSNLSSPNNIERMTKKISSIYKIYSRLVLFYMDKAVLDHIETNFDSVRHTMHHIYKSVCFLLLSSWPHHWDLFDFDLGATRKQIVEGAKRSLARPKLQSMSQLFILCMTEEMKATLLKQSEGLRLHGRNQSDDDICIKNIESRSDVLYEGVMLSAALLFRARYLCPITSAQEANVDISSVDDSAYMSLSSGDYENLFNPLPTFPNLPFHASFTRNKFDIYCGLFSQPSSPHIHRILQTKEFDHLSAINNTLDSLRYLSTFFASFCSSGCCRYEVGDITSGDASFNNGAIKEASIPPPPCSSSSPPLTTIETSQADRLIEVIETFTQAWQLGLHALGRICVHYFDTCSDPNFKWTVETQGHEADTQVLNIDIHGDHFHLVNLVAIHLVKMTVECMRAWISMNKLKLDASDTLKSNTCRCFFLEAVIWALHRISAFGLDIGCDEVESFKSLVNSIDPMILKAASVCGGTISNYDCMFIITIVHSKLLQEKCNVSGDKGNEVADVKENLTLNPLLRALSKSMHSYIISANKRDQDIPSTSQRIVTNFERMLHMTSSMLLVLSDRMNEDWHLNSSYAGLDSRILIRDTVKDDPYVSKVLCALFVRAVDIVNGLSKVGTISDNDNANDRDDMDNVAHQDADIVYSSAGHLDSIDAKLTSSQKQDKLSTAAFHLGRLLSVPFLFILSGQPFIKCLLQRLQLQGNKEGEAADWRGGEKFNEHVNRPPGGQRDDDTLHGRKETTESSMLGGWRNIMSQWVDLQIMMYKINGIEGISDNHDIFNINKDRDGGGSELGDSEIKIKDRLAIANILFTSSFGPMSMECGGLSKGSLDTPSMCAQDIKAAVTFLLLGMEGASKLSTKCPDSPLPAALAKQCSDLLVCVICGWCDAVERRICGLYNCEDECMNKVMLTYFLDIILDVRCDELGRSIYGPAFKDYFLGMGDFCEPKARSANPTACQQTSKDKLLFSSQSTEGSQHYWVQEANAANTINTKSSISSETSHKINSLPGDCKVSIFTMASPYQDNNTILDKFSSMSPITYSSSIKGSKTQGSDKSHRVNGSSNRSVEGTAILQSSHDSIISPMNSTPSYSHTAASSSVPQSNCTQTPQRRIDFRHCLSGSHFDVTLSLFFDLCRRLHTHLETNSNLNATDTADHRTYQYHRQMHSDMIIGLVEKLSIAFSRFGLTIASLVNAKNNLIKFLRSLQDHGTTMDENLRHFIDDALKELTCSPPAAATAKHVDSIEKGKVAKRPLTSPSFSAIKHRKLGL